MTPTRNPKTTRISITVTGGELYLLALSGDDTDNGSTSEICHAKSGADKLTIVPQSILGEGEYKLIMIGITWAFSTGYRFEVTLTKEDGPETHMETSSTRENVHVALQKVVSIHV